MTDENDWRSIVWCFYGTRISFLGSELGWLTKIISTSKWSTRCRCRNYHFFYMEWILLDEARKTKQHQVDWFMPSQHSTPIQFVKPVLGYWSLQVMHTITWKPKQKKKVRKNKTESRAAHGPVLLSIKRSFHNLFSLVKVLKTCTTRTATGQLNTGAFAAFLFLEIMGGETARSLSRSTANGCSVKKFLFYTHALEFRTSPCSKNLFWQN